MLRKLINFWMIFITIITVSTACAANKDFWSVRGFINDYPSATLLVGGKVKLDNSSSTGVALVGGDIAVNGHIAKTLFVAGGNMLLTGEILDGVQAAVGRLELTPTSYIRGQLMVIAGDVLLAGKIDGSVNLVAGRTVIAGSIDGDVNISGGELRLMPTAMISGKLIYTADTVLEMDPAAAVKGGIRVKAIDEKSFSNTSWDTFSRGISGLFFVGVLLLGFFIAGVLPRFSTQVIQTLSQRSLKSLIVGLLTIFLAPWVILLLFITGFGAFLSMMLLALLSASFMMGYGYAAMGLGTFALNFWQKVRSMRERTRLMLAMLVGLIILFFLMKIPFVGIWLQLLIVVSGFGALLLAVAKSEA